MRFNLKQILYIVLATSPLYPQAVPSADGVTGTVAGQIVNLRGQGVAGSYVFLVSELDPTQKTASKEFKATAQSMAVDPNGNFGFAGVAPGHYKLCAEPSHVDYANNCWWGDPVEIDVLPGRLTGPLSISVEPASPVRVRIQDPNSVRSEAKKEKVPVGFVANICTGTRQAVPMTIESDDGKELVLVAVAPLSKELKLRLGSPNGKFKDEEKPGVNPDKLSDEYTIGAGDTKAREIKVVLQGFNKEK